MNSDNFSLWQTEEKGNEELTLKELHPLLHGQYEKFVYDKMCITKNDKVTYLYGTWEPTRGFVVDYKVYEKSHENIVKIFLPPRGYNFNNNNNNSGEWDKYYEGYILQGVSTQSLTQPSDLIQLRKLYHACCPSTYLQFHTKRSGSAHYGNITKVFYLTDVSIFLSLLSHGYTLFSALGIDIVNNYADTPIP